MGSSDPLLYIALVVLLLFSAFFSSCETVISTCNRIRIKKQAQDGDEKAQKVLTMTDSYDRTLSTILIGNNIVNIAASTIATLLATAIFGTAGAWISTLVMTILVLVFGEIMPKTYSMENADTLALKIVGPLGFVITLLRPLSYVFSKLGTLFSKPSEDPAPTVTVEELMYIIESIEEEGVLEEQERDLVQSALEFDDTAIREIITPRVNLVALDINGSQEQTVETVLSEGYSRIPVYENTVDNIIGILYTRDFLRCLVRGESTDLRQLIKEPYFVHKGMKLSVLLANFKSKKVNLAVVLDEYGGTLGIVTMEDVLEELVGDIWDEDDEVPEELVKLDDTHFEVLGEYDILELLGELGYDVEDTEGGHTTVGGWASHMMEHIPQVGERFDYKDLRFTVLAMDGNRVARLGVEKYADEAKEADTLSVDATTED